MVGVRKEIIKVGRAGDDLALIAILGDGAVGVGASGELAVGGEELVEQMRGGVVVEVAGKIADGGSGEWFEVVGKGGVGSVVLAKGFGDAGMLSRLRIDN